MENLLLVICLQQQPYEYQIVHDVSAAPQGKDLHKYKCLTLCSLSAYEQLTKQAYSPKRTMVAVSQAMDDTEPPNQKSSFDDPNETGH